MATFTIDNEEIEVEIKYKPSNKRSYLRVKDGVVIFNTNIKLSNRDIENILKEHLRFIKKGFIKSTSSDKNIHFLGEQYPVEIIESSKDIVYIKDNIFYIELTNLAHAPKLVETFYINALKNIVEIYADSIIAKFDIDKNIIFEYRNAITYYGKCINKKINKNGKIIHIRKIILCSHLAKYELKYILSVIYHECAHFKVANHQAEFYNYLEKVYPNYRKVQQNLRRIRYKDLY